MRRTSEVGKLVLRGDSYVPEKVLKTGGKLLWDEIPQELRVSEERIRRSSGATGFRSEAWLEAHLVTYGCPVAMEFNEGLFYRCPWPLADNGYCKRHKKRAEQLS